MPTPVLLVTAVKIAATHHAVAATQAFHDPLALGAMKAMVRFVLFIGFFGVVHRFGNFLILFQLCLAFVVLGQLNGGLCSLLRQVLQKGQALFGFPIRVPAHQRGHFLARPHVVMVQQPAFAAVRFMAQVAIQLFATGRVVHELVPGAVRGGARDDVVSIG